jgi:hypothetical protein
LIVPAVHLVKHEGINLASEFKVVLCHNDKYLPICRSGKGLVLPQRVSEYVHV